MGRIFLAIIVGIAGFVSHLFDPTENSLILTDQNGLINPGEPCAPSLPGRIFRVRDLGDTGREIGPTASGATFDIPQHFSFDATGRVFVADRMNRRIVRMDDIAGNGWKTFSGVGTNVLSMLGTRMTCNQSDYGVYATAIDSKGRIYIATSNPQNIVRIDDMDGNGWVSFQLPPPFSPLEVVIDKQDRIYMADNQSQRIIRMDDMQGHGLVQYGSLGGGVGQFNNPNFIAFDAQGRIYISDELNHRIVRINDMTGAGWTTYGSYGSGVGQFAGQHGVFLDSSGRIYIDDTFRIARINSMTGDGWVTFGNRELQGRDFQFNASKGIHVFGQGPLIPYISVFPQVALGGNYRTSIIALNAGTAPADAVVSFMQAARPPCANVQAPTTSCALPLQATVEGASDSAFTRTVAPMGSMRLAASGNAAATGYSRLKSSGEVTAIALLQAMSGDLITSEAGVGASAPADHFTIYIDNTNGAQTGYALSNPMPEGNDPILSNGFLDGSASLKMTLRSKAGAILETTTLFLPIGGHISEFASQRFPNSVVPGFEGSIEFVTVELRPGVPIMNAHKVEAVALRYDNPAADVFTTVPVTLHLEDPHQQGLHTQDPYFLPARTTTLYYPQVADGAGYRTNFILTNPTDSPATVTLQFFADSGSAMSLPIDGVARTSVTVSLNARGVARVLTDGTASAIQSGWAVATSPVYPIGGSAIFQTVSNGRITSEAGVPSSPLGVRFLSHADGLNFAQSGVAISNPGNSTAGLTLNLRDTSGQVVATTTKTLPAHGHVAQFVTDLFGAAFQGFDGVLEVISNGPQISLVALRYDNPDSSVFATTPVMALPQ